MLIDFKGIKKNDIIKTKKKAINKNDGWTIIKFVPTKTKIIFKGKENKNV